MVLGEQHPLLLEEEAEVVGGVPGVWIPLSRELGTDDLVAVADGGVRLQAVADSKATISAGALLEARRTRPVVGVGVWWR